MERPAPDAPARGAEPFALHRRALALVREQRLDEAFALHLQAAEAGIADAMHEAGRMLLYGAGVAVDVPRAIEWLQRAEDGGSVVSGYELAMLQLGGHALPRDARLDTRVMAAAKAGFAPALRAAALHFGRRPQASDQALCVDLLHRGAQAGDALAALLLAERLQRGEGTPARPDRAATLYAQLARHGIAPLPEVPALLPDQPPAAPGVLSLLDALQPPAPHVLSEAPGIRRIDRLLSADECRLLIAAARPRLQASEIVRSADGGGQRAGNRTSTDATFDALSQDLALRVVQLRMAAAAGIDLLHGESLIILRYGPGQEYQPHRDYVPSGAVERDHPEAGNRARTICTYLNQVEAGGETDFPIAGVRLPPEAGGAVVFDNLHADGRPDPDTLHAGLPVVRGEKWLATIWLRQHRYRDW